VHGPGSSTTPPGDKSNGMFSLLSKYDFRPNGSDKKYVYNFGLKAKGSDHFRDLGGVAGDNLITVLMVQSVG
jgi:hypothetical protein